MSALRDAVVIRRLNVMRERRATMLYRAGQAREAQALGGLQCNCLSCQTRRALKEAYTAKTPEREGVH